MLKFSAALCAALIVTTTAQHVSAAPKGFMTFFDQNTCPEGWEAASETQGRLIVSVTKSSHAGVTVNQPLKDREDREHEHMTTLSYDLKQKDISGASGGNHQAAAHGTVGTKFNSNKHSSGLPFQQLLLCRSKGTAANASMAIGTIGFFSPEVTSCPANWQASNALEGRIAVPGFNEGGQESNRAPALVPGEDRDHDHVNDNVPVQNPAEKSFVGIAGCCDSGPALFEKSVVMQGKSANSSTNLPYITLLTCVSQNMNLELELPGNALVFSELKCPKGWSIADDRAGRLPVSLPTNGVPGASFGGASLSPTAHTNPVHNHIVNGTVNFPSFGIELASGCCGGGYMGSGTLPVVGGTSDANVNLPWTMTTFCRNGGGPNTPEKVESAKRIKLEMPPKLYSLNRIH